jgi:hypothetical protein
LLRKRRFPSAEGYATGSSGVTIVSEDGAELLASLQIASNGGNVTMDELDISQFAGQSVRVEVVDAFAGGWGWLAVDEITIEGAVLAEQQTVLRAGDADQALKFDQVDLVRVQIAAKYLSAARARETRPTQ